MRAKLVKDVLNELFIDDSGETLVDRIVDYLNHNYLQYQPGSPIITKLRNGGYMDTDYNEMTPEEVIEWFSMYFDEGIEKEAFDDFENQEEGLSLYDEIMKGT